MGASAAGRSPCGLARRYRRGQGTLHVTYRKDMGAPARRREGAERRRMRAPGRPASLAQEGETPRTFHTLSARKVVGPEAQSTSAQTRSTQKLPRVCERSCEAAQARSRQGPACTSRCLGDYSPRQDFSYSMACGGFGSRWSALRRPGGMSPEARALRYT